MLRTWPKLELEVTRHNGNHLSREAPNSSLPGWGFDSISFDSQKAKCLSSNVSHMLLGTHILTINVPECKKHILPTFVSPHSP